MNRKVAKLLTALIPSERHRRAVRRALWELPAVHAKPKGRFVVPSSGRYETLVVPRGFGHSGSGVIGDLLSEYEGTTVFGGADPDGSGRWAGQGVRNIESFEVEIVKMYGGLMDLASAFGESRPWGKFKLLNFIHVAETLYRQRDVPIYDDAFLARTRRFIGELTEASWTSQTAMAENPAFERREAPPDDLPGMLNPLYAWRDGLTDSFVMKNLNREEYERIARDYVADLLSSIPSRRILVLDQLLSADCPVAEFQKYVGPFKMIPVFRDPRDVFCTGYARSMPWIPNEPHAFVAWYRDLGIDRLRELDDPSVLVLRFEDLVLRYEETVARVESFVGLAPADHIRPKSAFDPSRSVKNIGIWKSFPDQGAIETIRRGLEEFCHG